MENSHENRLIFISTNVLRAGKKVDKVVKLKNDFKSCIKLEIDV